VRALIRRFDALLSQALGVLEFCEDGDCVLRLQIARSRRTLCLTGQEVRVGEPVLALHLWNEHVPPLPQAGPDLAWAAQMRRVFIQSLRAVAAQMRRDPRLAGVRAVGGTTTLLPPDSHSGGRHLMQRLGFTIFPYQSPLGRFGEFWENTYAWWLMWTYNVASLRHRQLLHLRRAEFWMTADEFLNRYGPGETSGQTAENMVAPAEDSRQPGFGDYPQIIGFKTPEVFLSFQCVSLAPLS
jgi:hypothetical protein